MLSDKAKHYKAPKKKTEGSWYPDNVKIEACKLWLITGNLRGTAAAMKIPYPTLQTWRYSSWWNELASDIKTEGQIELSNKLKKIAERALEVTLDRLDHGDWILNQKTGVMERKPVVMRDAHRVAESLIDRAVKLEAKPLEEAHNKMVEDRLAQLAASFAAFTKKTSKVEVIDVEDNYAIHDQRSVLETVEGGTTGLPPGEEPGVLPEEGRKADSVESSGEYSGAGSGETTP